MSLLSVLKFITSHPINENQKIRSMTRFARWQVSSRLAPGAIVFDWIDGARFLVRTGETGLTGNIYTGLHEFQDMGYLLHVLREDDVFIDIGANVGSYTILACAARAARGYAFEPIPSTFLRLTENIRLNGIGAKVAAFNVGLAQEEGTLFFTSDLDTVNHALAKDEVAPGSVSVKVMTLDKAVEIDGPTLIKIDVEGFETPVLEGAEQTLRNANVHSVIMELNGSGERYQYDEGKILSMMLAYGFKTYSYNPLRRELISLDGKNLSAGNTLFIRNESFVRERLHNAPQIHVYGKSF